MVQERRFSVNKAPMIRRADSDSNTKSIMLHFMIALIPIIIFGFVKNGLMPFINTVEDKTLQLLLIC